MRKQAFIGAFIALGCGLIVTACSNEDNVDNVNKGPVEARISANIESLATRAAGTAWTDGDAIGVTGTSGSQLYDNVQYVYSATTQPNFTLASGESPIYFQNTDDVTFTAYYPYAESVSTTSASISKTISAADQSTTPDSETGFTPQSQIDYLYGTGTGGVGTNGEVNFTFNHKMSQLVLNFIVGDDVNLNDLANYTLQGLKMQGTFDTSDGEASADAEAQAADLTINAETGYYDATNHTSTLILFPQAATSATLCVSLGGQTYTATLNFPTASAVQGLESGYSYTYNVTVSKDEMVVAKADIYPWQAGNGNSGQDVEAGM